MKSDIVEFYKVRFGSAPLKLSPEADISGIGRLQRPAAGQRGPTNNLPTDKNRSNLRGRKYPPEGILAWNKTKKEVIRQYVYYRKNSVSE